MTWLCRRCGVLCGMRLNPKKFSIREYCFNCIYVSAVNRSKYAKMWNEKFQRNFLRLITREEREEDHVLTTGRLPLPKNYPKK